MDTAPEGQEAAAQEADSVQAERAQADRVQADRAGVKAATVQAAAAAGLVQTAVAVAVMAHLHAVVAAMGQDDRAAGGSKSTAIA